MCGRHLGADARLARWNNRIEESGHVYAALIELGRHILGDTGFAEHHRYDWVLAGEESEPSAAHPGAKTPGIAEKPRSQVVAFAGEIDRPERGSKHHRRQRVREQIGTRALPEQFDNRLGCSGKAADRAAERLAKGTGYDVDLDARPGPSAAALRADETGGMAIINHHHGVMSIGKSTNVGQLGEIAIHREDPIGGDDDPPHPGATCGFELGFEIAHVAIAVAIAPG